MDTNALRRDAVIFVTFKRLSVEIMARLRGTIRKHFPEIFEFLSEEPTRLLFRYLGRTFEVRCEIPKDARDVTLAQIATYVDVEKRLTDFHFIFAFTLDSSGNINGRFTLQDFAEPYLEKFIEQAKKALLSFDTPIVIR